MKQLKYFSAFFVTLALLFSLGCASTSTKEDTGEYVDDSVITTKVKAGRAQKPATWLSFFDNLVEWLGVSSVRWLVVLSAVSSVDT